MSENEEQVPLTRRERRLREQGETGALDLSELAAAAAEADAAPVVDPEPSVVADDIEISPLNADGTPRSRREIRTLREQALAARTAAQEAAVTAAPETEAESESPAEPASAGADEEADTESAAEVADVAVADIDVADADADVEVVDLEIVDAEADVTVAPEDDEPVEDFDSLISPPTEPFTVEELRAAEALAETQEPEADASQDESEDAPVVADTATPASGGKSRLKFWKRDKAAEAVVPEPAEVEAVEAQAVEPEVVELAAVEPDITEAESAEASAEAVEGEPEAPAVDDVNEDSAETAPEELPVAVGAADAELADAELADEDTADTESAPEEPVAETVAFDAPVVDAPTVEEAVVVVEEPEQQPKETYSFPDIAPPEEWRSVFDDPATRNVPSPAEEPQGDFDDLISRAVAQEGSTNGTSALILPTMPEDTGGLTGPLGATGELYVTGSLRLPKSLGETGGHVSLHDSAEIDPITGAETVDEHGTVAGPAPVSARHAVSARVVSGVPAVAKPTKERTKLPLVLGLTGGGLLVVVVGLGIWGASNGMFG